MGLSVVGYTRVSTEEQAEGGVSLDVQPKKIKQFAELHELNLIEIVEDAGVSGKTIDRPGLGRVLKLLDSGKAQGVIVAKLDRLTRSVGDLAYLLDRYFGDRKKHKLFSLSESIDTTTAAGEMMLNLLVTVAQWERKTIVERTQQAMDHKRSQGQRISRFIPYGSRLAGDGTTLVPCQVEQEVIHVMKTQRRLGKSSRDIAESLNREAIPSRGGGTWSHRTILKVLGREARA
jgi:site-specific DNA recombinase